MVLHLRYDTRCYFNVRSKADVREPTTKKCEKERLKSKEKIWICLELSVGSGESVMKQKMKATMGRICEKGRV